MVCFRPCIFFTTRICLLKMLKYNYLWVNHPQNFKVRVLTSDDGGHDHWSNIDFLIFFDSSRNFNRIELLKAYISPLLRLAVSNGWTNVVDHLPINISDTSVHIQDRRWRCFASQHARRKYTNLAWSCPKWRPSDVPSGRRLVPDFFLKGGII